MPFSFTINMHKKI